MNRKVSRQTSSRSRAPMFVLLAMIFVVVGIIATIFSFFLADDLKKSGTNSIAVVTKASSEASRPSSEAPTSTASSSDQSSFVESNTEEKPKPPAVKSVVVGKTESVDKSYFDDAIFIGDSISKGLKLYGVLPAVNVIADQNVGLDQVVSDKPVYYNTSGAKITLFEALKASPTKKNKIYILLGSNGLPHYENNAHIEYYSKLIDRIKKEYPDATIYLQSVTPITKQAEADYKSRKKVFTNAKINEFNKMILKLAEDNDVYYLSVRDALVDKDGYLSSSFAGPDGVHFKKNGHEAMYQYYKTHTADGVPAGASSAASSASSNTETTTQQ